MTKVKETFVEASKVVGYKMTFIYAIQDTHTIHNSHVAGTHHHNLPTVCYMWSCPSVVTYN